MTQTTHGHHIPKTSTRTDITSVPALACGGIGSCHRCTKESNKVFDETYKEHTG